MAHRKILISSIDPPCASVHGLPTPLGIPFDIITDCASARQDLITMGIQIPWPATSWWTPSVNARCASLFRWGCVRRAQMMYLSSMNSLKTIFSYWTLYHWSPEVPLHAERAVRRYLVHKRWWTNNNASTQQHIPWYQPPWEHISGHANKIKTSIMRLGATYQKLESTR